MRQLFLMLLLIAIAVGVPALIALPVMKFHARTLPLSRLYFIAFWPMLIVFPIGGFVEIAIFTSLGAFGLSAKALLHLQLSVWFGSLWWLLTLCPVGALISRNLKQKGFALPFPGIGARAMASVWFVTEVIYLVYRLTFASPIFSAIYSN